MLQVEYRCPKCGFKGIMKVDEDREDPEQKHPICEDCSEPMNFVDSWED